MYNNNHPNKLTELVRAAVGLDGLGVGDKFGYGKERYNMIFHVRCINSDTHAQSSNQ